MSDDSNIEVPKNWRNLLTPMKEQPTLCIVGYDFLSDFNIPHFTDVICGVWSKPDSALNPFASKANYHAVMNWIDWRKKAIYQSEHTEHTQKITQQEPLNKLRNLQSLFGFDIVDQTPSGFLATSQLSDIHEVYGNIRRAKCYECGKHYESWNYEASTEEIILCEKCGGWIFPDISMFGWNDQVDAKSRLAKSLDEVENLLCIGIDMNLHPFAELKSTVQQKHLVEIQPMGIVFGAGDQVISFKETAKILGDREADYNALKKTPSKLSEGLSLFYRLNIALYVGKVGSQKEYPPVKNDAIKP